MDNNLNKTSLYEHHVKLNANLTPFGGYLMPLYYSSINKEHDETRNNVTVFDVSHMGKILLKGKDSYKFANYLLSNKIEYSNKLIYATLLNKEGHIIDDLMVYPLKEDEVLLVVNASNKNTDYNHIVNHSKNFDVKVLNEDDKYDIIALQGPNSENILKKIIKDYPFNYMTYEESTFQNNKLLISRSGYTGEDGFEIYANSKTIINIWEELLHLGVLPAGLGARDTLRFEAAFPLYGNELSLDINPFEAGISFSVDLSKDNFIGKEALKLEKINLKRRSVGIELLERNVPRSNYLVFNEELEEIGYITTGYISPTLKKPIALALIDINYAKINNRVYVEIRGKKIPAKVRNKSFLKERSLSDDKK